MMLEEEIFAEISKIYEISFCPWLAQTSVTERKFEKKYHFKVSS